MTTRSCTLSSLAILLALPFAAACGEGSFDTTVADRPDALSGSEQASGSQQEQVQAALSEDPELAHPNEIGAVQQAWFAGQQITVEEFDGQFVYEGDILLPPNMVRFEEVQLVLEPGEVPASLEEYNKLTARTQAHWPDGVVYYAIDPALPSQQRVTDAIAHWEANTNITFQARSSESDYVYFTPGSGCSSYVGKIGGKQNVTLASACSTGNTIHEIGHAIGLWHEHSRADRDNWVTIQWNNLQTGRDHNFKTYAQMGYDGDEFTDALDFGSIMMYSAYSFSNNGQPTITKKDGSTYSVQRSGLSSGDIEGIAKIYPEGGGEPEYVNGQYYTINGLTVYRYEDRWFYLTQYGWIQVRLYMGYWFYA